MSTADFISSITSALTNWGIDYTETSDGVGVGLVSIRVAEDGDGVMATVLDGDILIAMTSNAAKAATLLAFPLARKAWAAGYAGVFEVDVLDDDMDIRLDCGSGYVTLSTKVGSDDDFIITEHPLFSEHMQIDDLQAVIESAQLSYQRPEEAWQALCLAADVLGSSGWRTRPIWEPLVHGGLVLTKDGNQVQVYSNGDVSGHDDVAVGFARDAFEVALERVQAA